MESGVAEDFSDGYYDDASAYGDDEAQAWPSSAGPVAADDSPTMPEPTVSRGRKRDAKSTAKQDTLVLDRVVEGPYTLPPLSLLVAGDPPKKRSAANEHDGRCDQRGAQPVQGRRLGHRLHPRTDRHPLRGRTGPRRQGGEDHRAAEEHRLRGGHRERPDARADPGQVRGRHRGAQHRPRNGAPGRRSHRAVDPSRPPPAGDRAGQGHRRRLHLGQPGQDAAPAGRRIHRLR